MNRVMESKTFLQIKQHIESNSVFYRMLSSMALLCVVIVPLLTTVLFQTFERTLRNEVFEAQQQNLQLMAGAMDFRAEYTNYLMQTARENPDIATLMYSKASPSTADLRVLKNFRISVPQMISIYVYNRHNDWIYSSSGVPMYASCSVDTFEDESFVEMLRNLEEYNIYTPYLRYVDTPQQKRGEYVYTYVLYDTYKNGVKDNIIAMNFSVDWVENAVQYLRSDENFGQISIVTHDRQIVYSDRTAEIGMTLSETLPDDVLTGDSGYTFVDTDEGRQMVVYATPSRTGYRQWTFLSYVNYTELMRPMRQMRQAVILFTAVFFFVYLIMGALLSHRIYLPIKRTFSRVEALVQEQSQKRELERRIFLQQLLLGELPDAPLLLEERLQEHGIAYAAGREVRVILISVDHLNDFTYEFRKDMRYVDEVFSKALRKCLSAASEELYIIKMQDGIWAALGGESLVTLTDLNSGSTSLIDSLNGELKSLDVTVSMAVSDAGWSMSDVPHLFAETREELTYRFVLGTSQLISRNSIRTLDVGKYVYPAELESKVVSALLAGKYREAEQAYQCFVEQIHGFMIQDMRLSLMLLASAIKRSCNDAIVDNVSLLLAVDMLSQQIQSRDTLEEVNALFYTLFQKITDVLQENLLQKHRQTVERIQDYVQHNYSRSALSMNEVADQIDMSAAYLGRLFKQVTGTTFTEYLSNFRLQKACEALLTTDQTVSTIAAETGFTNSSYFYIVFKKRFNCTPSQYRQQNGVEE